MNNSSWPRKEVVKEEEEPIKIEDFEGKYHLEPIKRMTAVHFWFSNIVATLTIIVFLGLIIFGRTVPEYLIGFAGSILGYYIAKAPYDLFGRK